MPLHSTIARLVTERRGLVWFGIVIIAAGSILVLVTRMKLDTEVLNLLPNGFESVEGLKVYNRDFAQVRELTFALLCQPADVDKLEEFAPQFAESLRQQPWCKRVLAGTPMETPEGVHDLQAIAVPLLLNLDSASFDERSKRLVFRPISAGGRSASHLRQPLSGLFIHLTARSSIT